MIIEFRPGLFLTAILECSSLILKNLYNLPTIILERFNELFSGNCNKTINDDIPNTITLELNKELSEFNKNFRVFGTCPLLFQDLENILYMNKKQFFRVVVI